MSTMAYPSSVRLAREFVAHHLRCWGIDKELVHSGEIVTSELVTNIVRIAEGAPVSIAVSHNNGSPLVECWDPLEDVLPRARDAAPEDETGRGLHLIAALATRWGVAPHAGGGKTIWVILA